MTVKERAVRGNNPDGSGQRNGKERRSLDTSRIPRTVTEAVNYQPHFHVTHTATGRLLVPTQMAARLGCSDDLVRDLIDRAIEGQPHGIPGVKSGSRYYCAEGAFESWLRGHRHHDPTAASLDGDVGKLLEVALSGALNAIKAVRGRS